MTSALSEFSLPSLEQLVAAWGFKPGHAARLLRNYYAGADDLTPGDGDAGPRRWPAGLLERVRQELSPGTTELALRNVAADGTTKLLLRLADARTVESVLMPDFRADRAAGCVSSQVGCAMGCDFCATTRTGFERNLTAGEMVEQFIALRREARLAGRRVQTLVFMGMGEPLLNLEAVLAAVERIADNRLGALGWRQITVSTVGIVPGIDALTAAGLNVHLAVSLHAPDDATRTQLLPMGKRFANLGLKEMQIIVKETQFYSTPEKGLGLFKGQELPKVMKDHVVPWALEKGLVEKNKMPKIVFGNDPNAELCFDPQYIEAATKKK